MQTIFEPGRGDCMRACVASLLDVAIEEIPNFNEMGFDSTTEGVMSWALGADYYVHWRADADKRFEGYHIVSGMGPRGLRHSVVAFGDTLIHDPHPEGGLLLPNDPSDPDQSWLLSKVIKKGVGIDSAEINELIAEGEFVRARNFIQMLLDEEPGSHWLLTRFSMVHHELRDYKQAHQWALKALAVQPTCPLALWDSACALDMLDREDEAIDVWLKLIAQGAETIAETPCGESLSWAKSLVNDCRFRVASLLLSYGKQAEIDQGRVHLRHYMRERYLHDVSSTYAVEEVCELVRVASGEESSF